jgi:short-subunit dehydrogenase
VVAAALTTPTSDTTCLDDSLDGALELVDASVRGTMLLARLLADDMVIQGGGGIILTASPADMMPALDAAVYSASSGFVRAFAEELQDELRGYGVKVTALMPEPVNPGGSGFIDIIWALVGWAPATDPADIARHAFEALTCKDKQSVAEWATDAVTSLAWRMISDRVRGPVRHIISPTGEAM